MQLTARAAARLGVQVVPGFTGSSIWPLLYSFPPVPTDWIDAGYRDFADRWNPILDVFDEVGVKFALEVHPTEIAFDYYTAGRLLAAFGRRDTLGFNFDPSHLLWQGVRPDLFLRDFADRIYHVHMKDVAWNLGDEAGVFGGHTDFHTPPRYWDFKSVGRGDIKFEEIIRALNDIGYSGPLSVEWEDSKMDREHGAAEACAFVRRLDFAPSAIAFDAAFVRNT